MAAGVLYDFSGKTALITDGSRGLGFEMAWAIAQRGADIIIASRNRENCQQAAETLSQHGNPPRVQHYSASISTLSWDNACPRS